MALPASALRHLQIDVRAKIGTGGKTGAKALHDYVHEVNNITSRKMANMFRAHLRENHARFVTMAAAMFRDDDEVREVLMRHSHFKGGSLQVSDPRLGILEPRPFVYARLFNPLGTMSTAMRLSYRQLKDGSTKIYIRGADIKFQEYGTGWIGERLESHPKASEAGWAYNVGSHIKTDEDTGIEYWVYGQYARVGSPAGHFVYDAVQQTKQEILSTKGMGMLLYDIQQPTKELISALVVSSLGR